MTGQRLFGKSVIVTGAGRGIGRAISLRCAQEGATLVCGDVDGESAEQTAESIRSGGGSAVAVECDIGTADGNERLVDGAVRSFGKVDGLVANAATQHLGTLEATPIEAWERMERTNLRGVYLGIQSALGPLREVGGGSIVIIASVLGIVGDPDLPAYGAMKGGLRALTRAVATAHGPENIRCNTICPGDVATDMNDEFFDHQPDPVAARAAITDRYPLRRFAQPEDVAHAALFLISDEASYLTGIDLIVDGGLLARIY